VDPIDNSRPRAIPVLGWLRAWWSRIIGGLAFAVVAGVTGRISYVHIQALSVALHQSPGVARIMPFGVDGLIVVGSVALLNPPDSQPWLGWICVAPGSVVSLFANVMSSIADGWLSAAWAGVASMSFIAATYTLERWMKAQFSVRSHGGFPAAAETDAEAPSAGGADGDPEPAQPTTMEALRLLLGTATQRDLAFALRVDRNRILAWERQLDAAASEVDEPPAPDPTVSGLNGSAP
jgi:hypothetical protein